MSKFQKPMLCLEAPISVLATTGTLSALRQRLSTILPGRIVAVAAPQQVVVQHLDSARDALNSRARRLPSTVMADGANTVKSAPRVHPKPRMSMRGLVVPTMLQVLALQVSLRASTMMCLTSTARVICDRTMPLSVKRLNANERPPWTGCAKPVPACSSVSS